MKKNNVTFIAVLLLGLLAGIILSELLAPVPALAFLTKSASITWQPKADFHFIKYDLELMIKINIAGLLGIAGAVWVYRKM